MTTVTAENIFDRFSTVLQDAKHTRWTQAEFLNWLNSGQRAIAAVKPEACVERISVALVPGSRQSLPANGLQLIDVPRNMGVDGNTPGRAIVSYAKELLDRSVPNWHTLVADEVSLFCFDPRDPRAFFVYPAQPAAPNQRVEVVQAVAPARVSLLADKISLSDLYEGPLLDYCLYRAFSKDGEDAAQLQRATGYQQSYLQALGVKGQAEAAVAPGGGR